MNVRSLCAFSALVTFLLATVLYAADLETLEREVEEQQREVDRLREEIQKQKPVAQQVGETERRQGIFAEELRHLKEAIVLPETKELTSTYGLGPAASKVYGRDRGLSIGGYGEANFKNVLSDRGNAHDEVDLARFVTYVGYKFNDWLVLNSEIEFEHASTEEHGAAEVEFLTLDALLHPAFNLRGGLLILPMGFINEIHEPPFYHGNERPLVETRLLPSTWRANGFGIFGKLGAQVDYRVYGITSLDAKGFHSDGIRGGRQSGGLDLAEDWSAVARVDYEPVLGVTFGGSAYIGDQGQNQLYGNDEQGFVHAGVLTQIYELHSQARWRGLELRALGVVTQIDDSAILSRDATINQPIGQTQLGYYGEVAYDLMRLFDRTDYLAPWFRYSKVDPQYSMAAGVHRDPTRELDAIETGLSYKPIPQVVLKLDLRFLDGPHVSVADELRIGGGFVF